MYFTAVFEKFCHFFLRTEKVTEETKVVTAAQNTGSIFLKVLICIVLPTWLFLKNASADQKPFVIDSENVSEDGYLCTYRNGKNKGSASLTIQLCNCI